MRMLGESKSIKSLGFWGAKTLARARAYILQLLQLLQLRKIKNLILLFGCCCFLKNFFHTPLPPSLRGDISNLMNRNNNIANLFIVLLKNFCSCCSFKQ